MDGWLWLQRATILLQLHTTWWEPRVDVCAHHANRTAVRAPTHPTVQPRSMRPRSAVMSRLMAAGEAFSGKIRINARRRHADALEPLRSRSFRRLRCSC